MATIVFSNWDATTAMHRFYYPGSLDSGEIELTGAEAQHLGRVLRLSSGDCVEVFDGQGQAVSAEVVRVGKRTARLRILETPTMSVPQVPSIRLLTASPKSDRLRWLVEKATELGVERLSLLQTRHSVVHPGEGKLEKLNATVLAACKQCGRNDLMPIDPPRPWEHVLVDLTDSSTLALIATPCHPGIGSQVEFIRSSAEIAIVIGPEGGWDDLEVTEATRRGAIAVGLGPLILRIETAAIAAASAVRILCSDAR